MQRGATTSEQQISIHALREEGDFDQVVQFSERLVNFYPRPPRGGRRNHDAEKIHQSRISIHALREEGDQTVSPKTPPCWISIHALREEGDGVTIRPQEEAK